MLSEKKKNVYVVDDVLQNIQVICNNLKSTQIDISVANNGEQAIKGITELKPDLILLDISMPGIDGFEVCQRLKENKETAGIPIIFLTARSQTEDIVKGFKLGAVDYVTKPFNSEELRSRVFTHLEMAEAKEIIREKNLQLSEKNELLEKVIATKDKFFRIIAHDLKNPFSNMVGFTDILLTKFNVLDEEKKKYYINILKQVASKGNKILNNLHEWSLAQTGEMAIKPKIINIQTLAKENIDFHKSGAVSKSISLISEITSKLEIYADENMVNTVLRNLISNAIKFTKPGGRVKVAAKAQDDKIEVTISDNGLGIKKENIGKILSIDNNFRTAGTNKETGTGLGLILCREFIEKNKGNIRIESEFGKGSKIIFTLPAQKTD